MKKLLIFSLTIIIAGAASAQKSKRYRVPPPRVRTSISVGIGTPYYSPYYRPYPNYGPTMNARPLRVEQQIANIKADYKDRIWYARHNKSLLKRERKDEIRRLKFERDRAIRDLQYNYNRRRY